MARPVIRQRAFLDRRFRAVDEYLRTHLSDPNRVSLTQAASIAHVSPEHFCRLFHQRVGASFTDWQCAVRMERAKHLIVEQDMQLRAVSRAVGYTDESSFGRVFRRYEGVKPSQVRSFVGAYPELAQTICWFTAGSVLRLVILHRQNPELFQLLLTFSQQLQAD